MTATSPKPSNEPTAWSAFHVPYFDGQSDTHKLEIVTKDGEIIANPHPQAGKDYLTVSLADIFAMEPLERDKAKARAFIPSTYCEHDAREFAVQRKHGQFVCLTVDVDCGNHPIEEIEAVLTKAVGRAAWLVYSSANACPGDMRWRAIVPLAEPLNYEAWHDAQLALFRHFENSGIVVDRALARAAQAVFLPNVPASHKSGQPLRDSHGKPLHYAVKRGQGPEGLSLTDSPLAPLLTEIRQERAEEERYRASVQAQAREKAAQRLAKRKLDGDGSLIDEFNASISVADLLIRHGYEQSPVNRDDWRSPYQTSGSYATRVMEAGNAWVSLSQSDVAAGIGSRCDAGCFGDAYDLYVHFDHGGDQKAAFRELGRERRYYMNDNLVPPPLPDGDPGWTEPPTGPDEPDSECELIQFPGSGAVPAASQVEPVDLWQHYGAPALPEGLLPAPVEQFARRHAVVMGVDPAGLAMAALTVCGAAITDDIALQVKRHDPTWRESARLWVGLVGSPSMKKTPIISAALRPLRRIDGNLMRTYTEKRQAYDKLSAKEKKEADRPKQERRVISDATVEAAQEVLKDSPRGVLSAQDELSGWFGAMDKYAPGKGSQADRGFWLQAYNGGTYSLNRIGRGASYIANCSISLLGGIQPEPIRAIANDTHDDGLIQRLIPVVLRQGRAGRDIPADQALDEYERLIERLELMQPHDRKPLRLRDEARTVRERLEREHIDLVAALESVSPKLAAHFGKHDGLFARLCVLWHCVEHSSGTMPPQEISGATAERVAAFMEQFIRPSAIAFYSGMLGMSAGHEQLVALASWIVAAEVEEVKARDVQSSSQSFRHVTAEEVRLLCEKLEAFGWGEWAEPAPKSNKPRFVVNPLVHERFADRGKAEMERREQAREIIRSTLCG